MGNDVHDEKRVSLLNDRIGAYFDKQNAYERARDRVVRLMVPMQPAQADTIARIDELLEELDGFFTELGHIDEAGLFDLDSWQRMRVIRRIADNKIRSLDEVPEALRADFAHAFEEGAMYDDGRCIDGEIRRGTDALEEEIAYSREALDDYLGPAGLLGYREGFDAYLAGVREVPALLEQFIDHLNGIWSDYKNAAAALARHF